MTNSHVIGNRADSFGGGLAGQYSTFNIDSSTIRNNEATYYDGGGIQFGDGVLNVSASTVSSNNSGRDGGGIKLDEEASGTIINTTISNNTAARGGGGVEVWTNTLEIANSTVSRNVAKTKGGGVTAWYGASVTLTNTTVTENSAAIGSGAFTDPQGSFIFFQNTIVGNNKAAADCAGEGLSDRGNNVFGDASCSGTAQGNPRLGPLQINGETNLATHALLEGSPAIDAGDNGVCAGGLIANLDQRGKTRPFDGDGDSNAVCDVGAHENLQILLPPVDGGIQPAHSGVWFDTDRDGEGYFIFISNNAGQRTATIAYYTYDNGNQMWIIGTQALTPGFSTVTVPMTVTTGTSFSDFKPTEVGRADWGELSLTFTSCDAGTISYSSPEFGFGVANITKLATVSDISCNADGF
jgi:hypothetical protein